MNVSIEKTGNVSAILTVSIEENDYKEKVTKELKEIGKKHNIPGFRQGHVPFGELNRRFGKQVTSDVINNEVYNAVVGYIRDNKLGVLGEPLPVDVVELDLKKPRRTSRSNMNSPSFLNSTLRQVRTQPFLITPSKLPMR